MLTKTGEAEVITTHYLFALGMYRALYLINWIYRYWTENYVDWIVWIAGAVQTGLYCDFFYIYVTKYVLLPANLRSDGKGAPDDGGKKINGWAILS